MLSTPRSDLTLPLRDYAVGEGIEQKTGVLVTGPLWGRPVWGTFWTWEPRLTISAVQLLVYIAYGMLRASIDSPERQARFTAVYGIVAFVTVPLSWFAIRWWRTIHPDVLTGGEGMALSSRMVHTMIYSVAVFTLLYATLLRQRIRLEKASDTLTRLRLQADRA